MAMSARDPSTSSEQGKTLTQSVQAGPHAWSPEARTSSRPPRQSFRQWWRQNIGQTHAAVLINLVVMGITLFLAWKALSWAILLAVPPWQDPAF